MSDDQKIHALYFDAKGCGPAPLTLNLRIFEAISERDDAHLGIQFKAAGLTMIASPAEGGLYMDREGVTKLRDRLDAWIATGKLPDEVDAIDQDVHGGGEGGPDAADPLEEHRR